MTFKTEIRHRDFFLKRPSFLKGLKMVGLGERINIYVKELPVSYVKTQQIIAEIWKSFRPKVKISAISQPRYYTMIAKSARVKNFSKCFFFFFKGAVIFETEIYSIYSGIIFALLPKNTHINI